MIATAVPYYDVAAASLDASVKISEAVDRVVRSGWYVLGPEVEAFEAAWAAYCGTRFAVGVGNGLDALTLLLRALGVGPGDEVVVPAHTFVATWLAVCAAGAEPVGADVDPATGNLDPAAAAAALSPRTAAVVAVHLHGQPADVDALRSLCDGHGLALVEDAAQAHGATWRGRRCGGFGAGAGWSFYPGKNLGALGDGGAVTTDDPAVAERLRRLRNYGSTVRYVHEEAGVNSRLDELQAAVLAAKLPFLDRWNRRRSEVAAHYLDRLDGSVELLGLDPRATSAWHLFPVRHPDRDALAARLDRAGVGTGVHYPTPPHRTPAFARSRAGSFPNAERWAARTLSLPIGPALDDDQVVTVSTNVVAAASAS